MQYDRAKLKAVILHTCRECPPDRLGAVKLHKVLYFLDMIYYAKSGSAVTGATYRKRPFGPTCVQLLPALREMEHDGLIETKDVDYYGLTKKQYIAKAEESPGVLNEDETAVLDEVIAFVCHQNSAKTISDYSHQLPWEMAEFGEDIPYSTALLLFPSQVSPEAIEAVSEGAQEIEEERSREASLAYSTLSDFRSRVLETLGQSRI